jgi:hypothetical protein
MEKPKKKPTALIVEDHFRQLSNEVRQYIESTGLTLSDGVLRYLAGKDSSDFDRELWHRKFQQIEEGGPTETCIGQGVLSDAREMINAYRRDKNLELGRPLGAETMRRRAEEWKKSARDLARGILMSEGGALLTNDEIASRILQRLRQDHKMPTLSRATVVDALKGVRRDVYAEVSSRSGRG